MQRTIWMGVIMVLAGILLVWGVAFARPYQLNGSELENVPAPAIVLERDNGTTYQLTDSLGRITLLFFGYTYCPDVCPATLADMKRVKAEIGQAADQVDFVFITVDPQRDTPQRAQSYVNGFDSAFIGLSGSEEDLEPVWAGYWIYRMIQEGQTAAGYLVDHSARVYLVDKSGNLRVTYAFGTPAEEIAADVRYLLREK